MEHFMEILEHTIIDTVKLLPFLFITYLIMEYIEHKTSNKTKETIKKSGKFGPLIGGLLGAVPQCGFSVSATNLYAGRVITLGTLVAIFLSTSDEMIPVLISNEVNLGIIFQVLAIKITIGVIVGFIIDWIYRNKIEKYENKCIENICEHEHCHCENGILKSSIKHTLSIFIFILIVSLLLNIVIHSIGEETLANLVLNKQILGPIIIGLVGLIPNCASSVIITQLYVSGVLNISTMIGGLLVNSGLGIIVLFKVNKNLKENIKILLTIYSVGVISAILLGLII